MSRRRTDRRHLPLDVSGLPVRPVPAPPGAPHVLVVVVDDMGFGASSPFGGPCLMPTAQRLADGGLRFSRFHVTSLCSPTRQALLTGRNHHSVGMGVTTEMSTSHPGYSGFRPRTAGTLGQILRGNGWSTAAFGKWHQTPPVEVTSSGPFTRWPVGEGFETFYGFMGAEMNHWYPQLYAGTTPIEPDRLPEEGYHLTEDLVDHALDWLRTQRSLTPDRPFFTYLALGATHAPFHVAPAWIERYAGRFDAGWDDMRVEILQRQKALGVVPPDTVLAPWAEGVPHWNELDGPARRVAVRLMETYAGFAEHADRQVGRIVDTLEELGVLDDTLVVYLLGDNGASGEGGPGGTLREHLVGHGIADDIADMDARRDQIGGPSTYAMYPVGWALAMNTPYQWTKQVASHFGGTRDGLVVQWTNGFAARGEVRHQFHHVIDVLPTILDAVGVPLPETVEGIEQQPVEGISMRYAFDDVAAADRRRTQYFEMIGNRGIYHEGWTAVTRHGVPWKMTEKPRPFDQDTWELYDTGTDWSQAHDLAADDPERLERLRDLFDAEARAHQVLPLDDRVTERENPEMAGRLDLHRGRTRMVLGPNTGRLSEEAAPNVKNRSFRIAVGLRVPTGQPAGSVQGVLVAQGGRFGGWSLYVVDGHPHYAYNRYGRDLTVVSSGTMIGPGEHEVVLAFDYDGGPPGSGGLARLLLDDVQVASGRIEATTAYYFAFDETFNVGRDRGSPVVDHYPAVRNAFSGSIERVVVDLGEPTHLGAGPARSARQPPQRLSVGGSVRGLLAAIRSGARAGQVRRDAGGGPDGDVGQRREAVLGDAWGRPPDAQHRQQSPGRVEHRRGHAPRGRVVLTGARRPAAPAGAAEFARQRAPVGDRAVGEALQVRRQQPLHLLGRRPGQQHLAGRGGVQGHGGAHEADRDRRGRGRLVDVGERALPEHGQGGGLPGLPGDKAQGGRHVVDHRVEPRRPNQVDHSTAEPPGAGHLVGHHQPVHRQRGEDPPRGGPVQPALPSQGRRAGSGRRRRRDRAQ